MRTIYFADFVANNKSTYNLYPYEYTNKREAIKGIRRICSGNVLAGYSGWVRVYTNKEDRVGSTVYEATIR